MIPPLPAIRLRSISRWMQDNQPAQFRELSQSGELNSRVMALDEQMTEAFEAREDALMDKMMRAKTWGTTQGMGQFQTDRLTLWNETVAEFLAVTTNPKLVD